MDELAAARSEFEAVPGANSDWVDEYANPGVFAELNPVPGQVEEEVPQDSVADDELGGTRPAAPAGAVTR
jgi:hypothetical protein